MATRRVLLVISDGEHTANTDRQAIIDAAAAYRAAGNVVAVVAPRASGNGFDLMERIATPGFFINALPSDPEAALNSLNYLKSILCVGQCIPPGDEYVNDPSLNYSNYQNWEVVEGLTHLLGPGLLDFLPDNGLYVEMAGGAPAILRTIDSFEVNAGRNYEFSVTAAGNQRMEIAGQALKVYVRVVGAAETDPNVFEAVISPAWNQPFQKYSFAFNAVEDVSVRLHIEQLYEGTAPTIGNLVDRVEFRDATTLTTLLDDNFDDENLVYIEPRCGPSNALEEIPNPENFQAVVYFESGDPLVDSEAYQYAVSYVTLEGETAATPVSISGVNTTVTQENSVMNVTMPVPSDPRVISKRLWRSLGAAPANTFSSSATLYLLAEVDPDQVTYLDSERIADFTARYDNSVSSPDQNTTAVQQGALGVGYADCCYEFPGSGEEALVPEMTGNESPEGYKVTMGSIDTTAEEDWWGAFATIISKRVFLDTDGTTNPNNIDPATEYIQMQFLTGARTVFSYSIKTLQTPPDQLAPTAWSLLGSNDGVLWDTLDTRSGITPWDDEETKTFDVATPASYAYYRLAFTETEGTQPSPVDDVQFFGGAASTFTDNCPDCTAIPPGAQTPDPSALSDIESGDPQRIFTSTKEVCVPCETGERVAENIVPDMTSNNTATGGDVAVAAGVASASSELDSDHAAWRAFDRHEFTFWTTAAVAAPWQLQYKQLETALAGDVVFYKIAPYKSCPKSWTFEGSDDGSTWTVLDTQTNVPRWTTSTLQQFNLAEPASYTYYRLNISDSYTFEDQVVGITSFEIFTLRDSGSTQQSCATATRTSIKSQSDADFLADSAAREEATANLNCTTLYTVTREYLWRCSDIGQLGNTVSGTITTTSYVSQADAEAQWAAAAEAKKADLVCTLSNNEQQINILDFTGGAMAKASPYPSVQHITGGPASITKVVVNIFGFTHNSPEDVHLMLRSPEGTFVELMRYCGGTPPDSGVTNIDLVFDDDAGSSLPDDDGMVSGTFKPTFFGVQPPFPSLPAPPYNLTLAAFAGENANGSWSLWVCDSTTIWDGKISSWNLTIT